MNKIIRELRLLLSELLMGMAFNISPDPEQYKLAELIKEYYSFQGDIRIK